MPESARNPRLRQALEIWEGESVAQFYDCAFGMAGRDGRATADFSRELAPLFWNARLLVLRESYSNYCGGAHPNGGLSGYLVWDLDADRPVDVWKWIKGGDPSGKIVSKLLLESLASRYPRRNETGDNSCADALEGTEFFLLHPTDAGMVFSPSLPHVIQACAEDIAIPWAQMRPFLSPSGRKAVNALFGIP